MNRSDPESLLPLTHLAYHVLLALADTDRHGYGIIKEAARGTGGRVQLETGTLYAALKRLRDEGLIDTGKPAAPHQDQRRRYYRLTAFGRQALQLECERMSRLLGIAADKQVLPAASS